MQRQTSSFFLSFHFTAVVICHVLRAVQDDKYYVLFANLGKILKCNVIMFFLNSICTFSRRV